MRPTLLNGDFVIYKPVNQGNCFPKKGSIVVVKNPIDPEVLIIKRVKRSSPVGLELRGDNEVSSIDSRQFGLVNKNQLCGIVEQIIPNN